MPHATSVLLMAACVVWGAPAAAAASPESKSTPSMAGRMLVRLHSEKKDWLQQAEALSYLGRHRVQEAAKVCQKIFEDPTRQGYLRGRALVALTQILGSDVKKQIQLGARSKDPFIRVASAESMEWLGADGDDVTVESLLKDTDASVRYRALAAWAARHGAKAWDRVEPMTQKVDPAQMRWAVRALALVGHDAALARLQQWPRPQAQRWAIIQGMRGIQDRRLVPMLLELGAASGTGGVEFGAVVSALQRHAPKDLHEAMVMALRKPTPSMVRAVAVLSVRLTSSPQLGQALADASASLEDVDTIKSLLVALGRYEMEPDRHEALFKKHLKHADDEVRSLAVRCLVHCRKVNQYEALRARVNDDSHDVAMAALSALMLAPMDQAPVGQMIIYLQKPLTHSDDEIRKKAMDLLGHAGSEADYKPAMALFVERLNGKDDAQRFLAAQALGRIAPAERVPEVIQAQGYLSRWRVLGTFLNDEKHVGFNKPFPPETETKLDFKKTYMAKYLWVLGGRRKDNKGPIEREISWTKAACDQTDGRLHLAPLVPPPAGLAVAYVVSDFDVAEATDVLMSVDGDDAFRVWLNGEKVADLVGTERRTEHGKPIAVAVQNGLKIRLRSGRNRLLIKTANIEHDWWVRVRLTQNDGAPFHVREVAP